jgi:prepilin signal peptidase PulO-like enzyme (type II secretory pathway)
LFRVAAKFVTEETADELEAAAFGLFVEVSVKPEAVELAIRFASMLTV